MGANISRYTVIPHFMNIKYLMIYPVYLDITDYSRPSSEGQYPVHPRERRAEGSPKHDRNDPFSQRGGEWYAAANNTQTISFEALMHTVLLSI